MVEWVGTIAGAVVGFGGSWLLLFSQQRRQDEGVRRQLSALFGDLSTYMLRRGDWENTEYLAQWDQAFTRLRDRVYSPDVAASVKPKVADEAYQTIKFCEDVLKKVKSYKPRAVNVPGSTKHAFEYHLVLLEGAIKARTIQKKLGDKAAENSLPELVRLRDEQIAPLAGKSAEVAARSE